MQKLRRCLILEHTVSRRTASSQTSNRSGETNTSAATARSGCTTGVGAAHEIEVAEHRPPWRESYSGRENHNTTTPTQTTADRSGRQRILRARDLPSQPSGFQPPVW